MTAPPRRLRDLGPFTEAERRIRDGVGSGEVVVLGDPPASGEVKDLLPAEGDESRRVRAAFLRFLILGGDPDCRPHQKGVRVAGAWITGTLDLEGCRAPRDVGLVACRFDAAPVLQSAALDGLFLNHSHLPGLTADRLETRGGVFLRGATVRGAARLLGAQLGSDLACDDATFERPEGFALNADGLETRGAVFLRGATVRGEARLIGARLGGELDCVGATFERPDGEALNADRLETRRSVFLSGAKVLGETRLLGAQLGGNLSCIGATFERQGGRALCANGARIGGALFLRKGANVTGALDLTAAEIGTINDDRACWPGLGDLVLDRCRYGAFTGGPVDAAARLEWLSRQTPERWGEGFWPQPYVQLATVLREMGHDADARAVLIEKEKRQRKAARSRIGNRLERALWAAADGVLGFTICYGHQPLRALALLAMITAGGWFVFGEAAKVDALKPNNAFVLRAPEWAGCALVSPRAPLPGAPHVSRRDPCAAQTQMACFLSQPEAASYPRFNTAIYSIDAAAPVVSLEMQDYWIPDESAASPWGRYARWWLWFQIIAGWGLSLLAVAGFSGLVKKD